MIPSKLTINGEVWTVRRKPMARRGLHGLCLYTKRRIDIDSDLPEAEQQETFLHEVMHACLPEAWSAAQEEKMIRRLSPRLLETLKGIGWAR